MVELGTGMVIAGVLLMIYGKIAKEKPE